MSKLFETITPHQKITVWESEAVRSLYLDDDLQFDDHNELAVHEAFLDPLMDFDYQLQDVLILGGGDGGMARTTLDWFPDVNITQCELDPKVVEVSVKYFPKLNNDGKVFDAIDLKYGDGQEFIDSCVRPKGGGRMFDTTILDLTIHPQFDFESIAKISQYVSFFISYKTIEQFDLNTFKLFEDYRAEPVNIKGYHNDSIIFCGAKFNES